MGDMLDSCAGHSPLRMWGEEKGEVKSKERTSAGTAQTSAVSNEVEKAIAGIEEDFASV